uniref:Endonuclease/exonuclease/phosphatase domain-containing protein n=1 Tax=viral metagenome TaxID=1070528 RepID=A0A6C0I7Y0_9ZZZZ
MVKIISWNVNGIRSVLRKELWYPFVNEHRPDIICLQEVRATPEQFTFSGDFQNEYPYRYYNNPQLKKGYSGTAILSKIEPMSIDRPNIDNEGRVITAEFEDYYLVCVYVPNAGSRFNYRVNEWDHSFREYLFGLDKKLIICGDFNVACQDIDIYNPNIRDTAGVTLEERFNFNQLLERFVDSFRLRNPELVKYTWWSNLGNCRSTNRGWRIDYFLVSKNVDFTEADILENVQGSDHCPIILIN